MREGVRFGRLLNVAIGLSVAVGPWLVEGSSTTYALTATLTGVAVAALSLPAGPRSESYGGWDRFVR